jgi:hypothetical protein
MQFYSRLILFLMFVCPVLFSCKTSDSEGDDGSGTTDSYWKSSSLVRMNLNGKVKTLIEDEHTYRFDEDGNLTSESYVNGYSGYSIYNEYQNGELISQTRKTPTLALTLGDSVTETTYFEYDNSGKYIPLSPIQVSENGLVPDLSAKYDATDRSDYTFHGSDLWIVTSTMQSAVWVSNDTSIVRYSMNYPFSFTGDERSFNDLEYSSDGKILYYRENYFSPDSSSSNVLRYQSLNGWMLLSSKVCKTILPPADTSIVSTSLLYNENGYLLSSSSTDGAMEEYSDYVYDVKGNWTARKQRSKTGSLWSDLQQKIRTLEYYE